VARFFVSGPLGFENKLIEEIESFWFKMIDLDGLPTRSTPPEMKILQGGVEFETEMHLGLQINFFTKLAYRLLIRSHRFSARYYDQLEKGLAKISLESFLKKNAQLNFKISTAKSRVNNEKNILEVCQKIFTKLGYEINENATQQIYLRIFKDEVELSLDCSGEHLHKRGYRHHQAEAPIRENLAALMWSFLPIAVESDDTVVDPFCGSGTLLFEFLIRSKPNFSRSYPFLVWNNCPAIIKSPTFSKNFHFLETQSESLNLIGCDIDGSALDKARKNLDLLNTQYQLQNTVEFIHSNCNVVAIAANRSKNLILVANPPYGERLIDENSIQDLTTFITQRGGDFKKIVVLLLQPVARVPEISTLGLLLKIPFNNQGLKLNLLVYCSDRNIKI
jgi:putative N6-adenine-specific DNA methylase